MKSTDLCHNRIDLLHAEGENAGQKGFESLTGFLYHHLQDSQELLYHSATRAALLQNTGCQLFPKTCTGQHGAIKCLSLKIPTSPTSTTTNKERFFKPGEQAEECVEDLSSEGNAHLDSQRLKQRQEEGQHLIRHI